MTMKHGNKEKSNLGNFFCNSYELEIKLIVCDSSIYAKKCINIVEREFLLSVLNVRMGKGT